MNEEEMFEQLNDLINDRNSLIGSDEETNVIYKKDIRALKQVIKGYKEFNLELSGYRKAILQDKEMLGLKEQLQQKEFIEYLENEIKRYRKILSERPTNDLEYNNYKVTDVALEQIKIVLSKYKEIIGGKNK